MRHVIWDWNGTLLDDLALIVEAVNVVLDEVGAPVIDAHVYRTHYTRPVQHFYERLLGRALSDDEWLRIDYAFHAAYAARAARAPLATDCAEALIAIAGRGATQSLLSMLPHEDLVPAVRQHRLDHHMLVIDGLRGKRGDSKAPHLERHLTRLRARLPQLRPDHCVMIGDSLDDAVAAKSHGIPCVLYEGGAHHRSELQRAGTPVASSLLAALSLAGVY